jgi:phenylacetate-CoA ligase
MQVIARARGTMTILRALRGQRRLPYAPRAHIEELRDRRVRETVVYAAEHVPYYRDLFRRHGIDPRELASAADLTRLPLLDRNELQADPNRFRSTAFAERDVLALRSSGRTGVPVCAFHDQGSLLAAIAHSERDRAVEAHFCGRRYRYPVVEIRSEGSTVAFVQGVYRGSSFRPFRPRVHVLSVETPPERVVDELNRLRPAALRAYGSYAEAFFRLLAAKGLHVRLPRVVVYIGDDMSPAAREFIERRFGVPVISRYGAIEALRIGFMCEERDGFHLHEDLCHVRLVDPEGRNVRPGEVGRVVVSNLINRGSVLLNYELEDLARWTDEPCACGRTLHRLLTLEGRVAEVLHLDDGRFVHQYAVWHTLSALDGLVNFQLAQIEPRRFELRLQAEPESYERIAPVAVERLADLLPGCRIVVSNHERLELVRRNGKLSRILPLASERR